jgi:hypothetical protein
MNNKMFKYQGYEVEIADYSSSSYKATITYGQVQAIVIIGTVFANLRDAAYKWIDDQVGDSGEPEPMGNLESMKLDEMITGTTVTVCNLSQSISNDLEILPPNHPNIINRRLGITGSIIQTYRGFEAGWHEWCLVKYDGTPDMKEAALENPQWHEGYFHFSELCIVKSPLEIQVEQAVENLAVINWLSS